VDKSDKVEWSVIRGKPVRFFKNFLKKSMILKVSSSTYSMLNPSIPFFCQTEANGTLPLKVLLMQRINLENFLKLIKLQQLHS
jgi:hypothetical protein